MEISATLSSSKIEILRVLVENRKKKEKTYVTFKTGFCKILTYELLFTCDILAFWACFFSEKGLFTKL